MRLFATLTTGEEVELVVADGLDLSCVRSRGLADLVAEAGSWVATPDGGVRRDAIIRLRLALETGDTTTTTVRE